VDPYHGQQNRKPEPEAMDLPEDLNLDQEEEAGDDGEGEGDGEARMQGLLLPSSNGDVHMALCARGLSSVVV